MPLAKASSKSLFGDIYPDTGGIRAGEAAFAATGKFRAELEQERVAKETAMHENGTALSELERLKAQPRGQ